MRSFILFLKRVGLQKIVGVLIAVVLIIVAGMYVFNQSKVLDPKLQSQFDQGKYADSIPTLEKWIAENPQDVKGMEVLAAFYIQKASNEQQTKSETLKKAMDLLGTIIKLDPQKSESFRLVATSYLMKEEPKLATENFLRAIRASQGKNLDALAGLSMVHEFNKDWDKAFLGYKNVLRKDPNNEMANLGAARYYISLGNANDAMDYAWKVANSSSNNASLGEAYAVLGSGMKILKQPEISKTYFEKSISFRPNNIHTLVLLGESYIETYPLVKKEDRQDAINRVMGVANKAIALNPDYIHAQTLLYKVLLLQNKYAEANVVGKKIVSLLASDKTLTPTEKDAYKKFYSGEITAVKINSIKVVAPKASTTTATKIIPSNTNR